MANTRIVGQVLVIHTHCRSSGRWVSPTLGRSAPLVGHYSTPTPFHPPADNYASYFPRTTAVAAVMVVGVYVPLIRSGVVGFSWSGALSGLGRGCFEFIVSLYVTLVPGWLWIELWSWLWMQLSARMGRKKSPEQTKASFGLWDREFDE